MAGKQETCGKWDTATTALLARVEQENPIVVHTGSYSNKDDGDTLWLRLDQRLRNDRVAAKTVTSTKKVG